MRCRRADRLIEPYLDGRLSLQLGRRMEHHIGRCPQCAGRLAEARRLSEQVLRPAVATAPPALAERVMNEIYREPIPAAAQSARKRRFDPAAAYRRAGLSFVITAIVLATSLFIPHGAYPSLVGVQRLEQNLAIGQPAAVGRLFQSADQTLEGFVGLGGSAATYMEGGAPK
jgi:anti-sigma factor RsiW